MLRTARRPRALLLCLLRRAGTAEFVALANGDVDGLLHGHTFIPTEPLPRFSQTPLDRKSIEKLRLRRAASLYRAFSRRSNSATESTVAIDTTLDPAGRFRELIELRELTAQLAAKVRELEGEG